MQNNVLQGEICLCLVDWYLAMRLGISPTCTNIVRYILCYRASLAILRYIEPDGDLDMFGMHRGCGSERWASGKRWRGSYGGFGWGGKHGMGGGDMLRAGRMLATGDLKLLALALIEQQPRHGYDIIKVLEEKTAGWYSPSPALSIRRSPTWKRPATSPPRPMAPRSSTPSRTRAAHISTRTAPSSTRCWNGSPRSAKKPSAFAVTSAGDESRGPRKTARTTTCRARSAAPSRICPRAVRQMLKDDPTAKTRVIEALDRAAEEMKKKHS